MEPFMLHWGDYEQGSLEGQVRPAPAFLFSLASGFSPDTGPRVPPTQHTVHLRASTQAFLVWKAPSSPVIHQTPCLSSLPVHPWILSFREAVSKPLVSVRFFCLHSLTSLFFFFKEVTAVPIIYWFVWLFVEWSCLFSDIGWGYRLAHSWIPRVS